METNKNSFTIVDARLLSIEEYAQYKSIIPHVNKDWWLCSPGTLPNFAAYVYDTGTVRENGMLV